MRHIALSIMRCSFALAALLVVQACAPAAPPDMPLPAGLPAMDRAWTSTDYVRAVAVIAALPNEQLPRSSSESGAQLIARLTDPALLADCGDTTAPVLGRMDSCLPIGRPASALFQRYIAAADVDRALADDALELSGFLLLYTDMANKLSHEFMPTIDPADPTYQRRLVGVAQMRRGMANMLLGGAMALQDRSRFSEAARVEYAAKLGRAFQYMAPDLSARARVQVAAQFTRAAAGEPNATIRSALTAAVRRTGSSL